MILFLALLAQWNRIKVTVRGCQAFLCTVYDIASLKKKTRLHCLWQEYLWTVAQPKEDAMVTLVLDLAGLGMSTIMNKEVANIVRAQVGAFALKLKLKLCTSQRIVCKFQIPNGAISISFYWCSRRAPMLTLVFLNL